MPVTAAASVSREGLFRGLERSVPILLGIFVFFNPVPYTTAIKEVAFYGALAIVLVLAGCRRIALSFRSPLTAPFVAFTLWAGLGLFFALDKENSLHDFQTHWLKYLALYYVLINVFNTRERLTWLAWALMVPAALVSLGLMVHHYGILGRELSVRLVTGLPEIAVNGLGIVAVPAALMALHQLMQVKALATRLLSLFCLLVTGTLCFFTQARGTILALLVGLLIVCLRRRKLLAGSLGLLLVVIAATPMLDRFLSASALSSLRLDAHWVTWQIMKDYPVTGIGFGMQTYGNRQFIDLEAYQRKVPPRYRGHLYDDPHSMPFSVAVRTGLIGLGLFGWILWTPFRMVRGMVRRERDGNLVQWGLSGLASLTAILIIGFFEPFFSHVPEVVLFTLLAMVTIAWRLDGAPSGAA